MKHQISTGQAARLLGTTEPKLADTVRRGRVRPEPPIFAGRRLWSPEQVLQAAEALGIATDDLRFELQGPTAEGGSDRAGEGG